VRGWSQATCEYCPKATKSLVRTPAQFGKKIRCVVAHDLVLLRQGLRRLLEDEPDIAVVAEAEDAAQTLREVFTHRPEIVIADAHIFECTAEQSERLIVQQSPESKVLFLTSEEQDESRRRGSCDATYAVRRTSADELVQIVRKTAGIAEEQANQLPEPRVEELIPRHRILTSREREVLKLLAEGETVRSAASVLGLSIKTVDAHKFNLMRKLGIHNKAELVMWAIQKRVVKVRAGI
jgi:two-component system, NarL family, response regulator NreC